MDCKYCNKKFISGYRLESHEKFESEYIENMNRVTMDSLLGSVSNLTLDHVKSGVNGYVKYALEYALKNSVLCVDYDDNDVKYKDGEGLVVLDKGMKKLMSMFCESIVNRSSELVFSCNNPDMDSDMFEEVAKLFNVNADVKGCIDGIWSEFSDQFIEQVCINSIVY